MSEATHLTIGKRGEFAFPAGYYAYVGSAFGAGGLRGRLKHHLSPVIKPHWHIDYLRAVASVTGVWWTISEIVYEHRWEECLRIMPDASIPVPRFGASDCKCTSHLVHFSDKPERDAFCKTGDLGLQGGSFR